MRDIVLNYVNAIQLCFGKPVLTRCVPVSSPGPTRCVQDCLFVHPLNINTQPQSMMYMVCDGHSGVEAANFVTSNFLRILNTKLPAKMPNFSNTKGG